MSFTSIRIRLGFIFAFWFGLLGIAPGQEKEKEIKTEKQPAKIKVLVPDYTKELKIEGKETKASGDVREFKTPPLEPGKTYQYLIEIMVEPNNYTKIYRKREVQFKAGETVSVDMRSKDAKFPDDVRIRWVPTPPDIVEEMAKLAKVGKEDIVYDLGCGDAITIRIAVKKFGAKKGVGIDIDPKKVEEAKQGAKDDGIADKIEIREKNILKLDDKDIGDASVVMLYLGNEMLANLRPTLWKHLKPGTRIVSHRFVFGDDWKPEKTITVMGQDGDEYELHLWTIKENKEDKQPKKEQK